MVKVHCAMDSVSMRKSGRAYEESGSLETKYEDAPDETASARAQPRNGNDECRGAHGLFQEGAEQPVSQLPCLSSNVADLDPRRETPRLDPSAFTMHLFDARNLRLSHAARQSIHIRK